MVLIRLDELSNDELKNEFEKAGLKGSFEEAECLIRLTIHLVKVVGKDPFSFRFKIDEEIMNSKRKDLEVEVFSSCWPAEGLSAETSSMSLPETLPLQVGSFLKSKDARCEVFSTSCLDDTVSTKSMSTLPWSAGSSLMSLSFPSSSHRAVSFASRESQPLIFVKKWIGESDGDSNVKIFGSVRPVMWPHDMCFALRQQHLDNFCTQHIYCLSC